MTLIVLTPIWLLQSSQKNGNLKINKNFTFVAFSKYILMYKQGFLTNNAVTKIRQGRAQHSLKWKQNKKTVHPRSLNPAEKWDHIFMVLFPWKSNEGLNPAGPKPGYSHTVWVTADEDNFATGLLTRELGKHHYLQWLSCHPPWKWASSVYVSPSKSQYALGSVESH